MEGFPIVIVGHEASVQDRDGVVIRAMLEKTPTVIRLDGGYQGPKLALQEMGLAELVEIVSKPKESKGFTVIPRRWVVERTFAWMLPTVGQGFRADTGEVSGVGAAGSLPVPDAPHRARENRMKTTYLDSDSEADREAVISLRRNCSVNSFRSTRPGVHSPKQPAMRESPTRL